MATAGEDGDPAAAARLAAAGRGDAEEERRIGGGNVGDLGLVVELSSVILEERKHKTEAR